jgi:DNA (cytosine-5)-methyltransferase 1
MRLLDLFCGAGGASVGYWRAGFRDIIGVDIMPQPNYPRRFAFVQADALQFLAEYGYEFDAIHASPPCQAYAQLNHPVRKAGHPQLIEPCRALLKRLNKPYIIENVPSAPLYNPVRLCGQMFGLGVIRHRYFESNLLLFQPPHAPHLGSVAGKDFVTVAGNGGDGSNRFRDWCRAMGIYWMTKNELREAIPPAYTEYLGRQLLAACAVSFNI